MRLLTSLVIGISIAAATAFGLASQTQTAARRPLVVIFMENKERSQIVGNPDAPYMNSLLATGRDFTHYYGVTHPSLPNYLVMGNGSTNGKQGTDSITAGEITGTTMWTDLTTAGIAWKAYMESMPSNCYSGTSSNGYVLKHNPATPFADVYGDATYCQDHVQPYTPGVALEPFTFISPNLCNDTHDCSIATGDAWLQANVPPMLAAGAIVIVTYDEGSTSDHGGGNIYAVLVRNGIRHSVRNRTFNHYSLLAGIEDRFGLERRGGAIGIRALPI